MMPKTTSINWAHYDLVVAFPGSKYGTSKAKDAVRLGNLGIAKNSFVIACAFHPNIRHPEDIEKVKTFLLENNPQLVKREMFLTLAKTRHPLTGLGAENTEKILYISKKGCTVGIPN